jgi:hypothetical protein
MMRRLEFCQGDRLSMLVSQSSSPSGAPVKTDVPARLDEQEFRFCRYRSAENLLVLEINEFPETSPEVLPSA